VQAWKNQGSKSMGLSEVIKSIYEIALKTFLVSLVRTLIGKFGRFSIENPLSK
jgi:hypothetical protein